MVELNLLVLFSPNKQTFSSRGTISSVLWMITTVTEGLYLHCESLSLAEIHWMAPLSFFPNDCVLEEEEEFYRLNRVLPKLVRWSPKPQYFRMWLDFETVPLKRWLSQNETFRWALIQSDQCPHRRGYLDTQGNIRDTWTQSKEHVKTMRRGPPTS